MSARRPPPGRARYRREFILLPMGGESGRSHALPLLPAGSFLFEHLPARAIVIDALAPAVANGVITLTDDGDRTGVLVIRDGGITDAVSIDDGTRSRGDAAFALMSDWTSASMSACRWNDPAMSLLDSLIHGAPCYEDLRLKWTAWSQLLEDLRARDGTFVVELFTPNGRGVTVIRGGKQVATYTDAHPSLGDPDLIDALAAGGTGSVRVLIASGVTRNGMVLSISQTGVPARTASAPPSAHERSPASAPTEVRALLPELQALVHERLQRSSGPVDDLVDAAADEDRNVEWLAQRVRAMTVRGFIASTFERLADDMLAIVDRA
jgi:hypothetical protein